MTAIADLATRLCGDMVRAVAKRGTREFIITRFSYPDGDLLNLYIESTTGNYWLSDLGITLSKFRINGIELTSSRSQFIQSICNVYGLELDRTILRKRITESPNLDSLAFCEAIARISTLEYLKDVHKRSSLPDQLEHLLEKRVEPQRTILRKWYDKSVDFKNSHPVDFRINGPGQPRNIFHVAAPGKSNLVSAVCNYFKVKKVFVPTMAVIDPDVNLGPHFLDRLQLAVTHIRYGVAGGEDAIVRFALDESLN